LASTVSAAGSPPTIYQLGANEKIVQRIMRHAKPHVAKDRYIKAYDPAALEAMQRMKATVGVLENSPADELRQAC
jgi:hypothetical protein